MIQCEGRANLCDRGIGDAVHMEFFLSPFYCKHKMLIRDKFLATLSRYCVWPTLFLENPWITSVSFPQRIK